MSVAISMIFLIITLIVSDIVVPTPFSSEKMMFKVYEHLKTRLADDKWDKSMTDSVVLIDTHYAKTLVMEDSIGKVPVSDRKTINNLLCLLKERNDYRYIILDISLDKAVSQIEDTALHKTIITMPRIIIANPKEGGKKLADTVLYSKAGRVWYYTSEWETDFVKYPYIKDKEYSLPMKMYEELNECVKPHNILNRDSVYYTDDGTIIRNSVFLTFSYNDITFLHDIEDAIETIKSNNGIKTKGKYILIGDYKNDQHHTYIGEMPGTLIHFNAYLALTKGEHKIKFGMVAILFLVLFTLTYLTLTQSKFTWIFMWIGYPVFLALTCFIIYYLYNQVYDILITSTLFYCLKTSVECYRERSTIHYNIKKVVNKHIYTKKKLLEYTRIGYDNAIGLYKNTRKKLNKKYMKIIIKFKLLLIFYVILSCVNNINAQPYYAVDEVSGIIKIDGKQIKKGDILSYKKGGKIQWGTKGRPWIRGTRNNEVYKIDRKGIKKIGNDISNRHIYDLSVKDGASRTTLNKGEDDTIQYYQIKFHLIGDNDYICFERNSTKKNTKIKAIWEYNGKEQSESIECTIDEKYYIITPKIFQNTKDGEYIKIRIREEDEEGYSSNFYFHGLNIAYYR